MENNELIEQSATFDIIRMIRGHRENAYRRINEELITLYFEIGEYLSQKVALGKWGSSVIDGIAERLHRTFPTLKGFNRRGLYRMMQFYETYKSNEIVSALLSQISWTNHIIIMSKTKSADEREFYMRMCIKNNYSSRELNRQISSGYYQRYLISGSDATPSTVEAVGEDDIPITKIMDCYSLEFLDLPSSYSEKDLRKAIVGNLKDFVMEIGRDFAFIGEEYRLQIADRDYYIDLLFFNRTFNCLVAFELKIDEFQPEYVSKMNFYLEILDRHVKRENENPSIGIILCASKNDTIVEYATSRTTSPLMVSEYATKLIDRNLLERKVSEIKGILEQRIKAK